MTGATMYNQGLGNGWAELLCRAATRDDRPGRAEGRRVSVEMPAALQYSAQERNAFCVDKGGEAARLRRGQFRLRVNRGMGWNVKEIIRRFLRGNSGQMVAEYTVLVCFFTLIGVTALVTFFFAFEEGVIGYYEDIVNVICLPIP